MPDRYWVGGTAAWDGTAGTKWAATSGGAGGESVPTSADDVYFDAASGAVTVTVSATANCFNLNFTGFTGTFGMTNTLNVYGSLTFSSSMTLGATANQLQLLATSGDWTFTSAGKTIGPVRFGGTTGDPTYTLQDALVSSGALNVAIGTFNTNDYNVTASSLSSSNTNTRTINLGSSTVTLSGTAPVTFTTKTNLTFNAGTSTIVCSSLSATFNGNGLAFYDLAFTSTTAGTRTVASANTFNSLSVTGPTAAGVVQVAFSADQTINGTLTLSAGTNATARTFVRSNIIGTARTLTCNAVASLQDIDFRDITIAGAAVSGGNLTGTRLGDCKGNSGITFDAPKTVYWRNATAANWGATTWASSIGGTADVTQFPLAQDTAVFPSSYPNNGITITINHVYNIGTIDMSARTSNTMTLVCFQQSPTICGDWINGTGVTLSGTGTLTFAGRNTQTITSAGRTFTQAFTIDTPGGSVVLQDALIAGANGVGALRVNKGIFDANNYNVTLSGNLSTFVSSGPDARVVSFGTGVWTFVGQGTTFNATNSTNLTVTGTGTISLTSASAKIFAGGGIQTYPTLNQGGTGTLTVTGSNKFAGLTNTAIGRIQFTGGTTQEITNFNVNGVSGNLLQIGSTNTTQVTLRKTGAWNVGANSTDAGNNTGLSFTAGGVDYLSISYINGEVLTSLSQIFYGATNITSVFYGSTPVSEIYYGSTKVF